MKARSREWRLFALLLMLALVASGLVSSAGPARADTVPTGAQVSGGNTPPRIECKWELPDMQSGVANTTFPDGNIQYGTASNAHTHDDDMTKVPDADNDPTNGIQIPCQGPPGTVPTMPNGVRSMIQVRPNADDQPEERRVQLWAAVDHQNGISNISDVFWKVFHPDGTFKVQVHGTKVLPADCAKLGTATQVGTMFEAAVHTGQVSAAAVDDINKGLVAKCQEQEKALYYAQFTISKEQPCGEYSIELHAVSNGSESILTNKIDVICFTNLQIDFNKVDWGTITPGLVDIVSGDLLFLPPADGAPTVKNTGNHGMGVGVRFSSMVQVDANGQPLPGGKTIDSFDAAFGKSPSTIQSIDPIPAGTTANFDDTAPRVLCANQVGKLDLSIHPPSTLPPGNYAGTVDVLSRAVHSICSTDQEAHGP